jgi:chromosome segregation protein
MARLYGVPMPEKGISQLVAGDLQKAEGMVA